MDVLGIPTVLVPPNPGNVSAFGLLTVDVKNDYVQTHVALADALDPAAVAAAYDAARGARRRGADQGGLRARAAPVRPHRRPALLRPGLRGAGAGARRRPSTQRSLDEVAGRFHAEHRALYGYDFSGDPTQQVEWVNLRVSGIGPIKRPEIRRRADSAGASRRPTGGADRLGESRRPASRPVLLRRRRGVRRHAGRPPAHRSWRRGRWWPGR